MGYESAGFTFLLHAELQESRAEVGKRNFPQSKWIVGDLTHHTKLIKESTGSDLNLLVATPPCQGLSSSNPSRGKRKVGRAVANEKENSLVIAAATLAERVRPRIFVAENVRQILTLHIKTAAGIMTIPDAVQDILPDYTIWTATINVANYGVPQDRRRAVIVAMRSDEPCVEQLIKQKKTPFPVCTHHGEPTAGQSAWLTIEDWLKQMKYQTLDSSSGERSKNGHVLHTVPHYGEERYRLISDIPARSGKSAYQNSICPNCGQNDVPEGRVKCPACRRTLWNRPIVRDGRSVRLIKGFKSSYRRMRPDEPARTITTNSSHVGSDFKIHPYENRVMSALECADLQTVPRWFDWSPALDSNRAYLVRNLIGEAFPPYFTYLHGLVLKSLLSKGRTDWSQLADE